MCQVTQCLVCSAEPGLVAIQQTPTIPDILTIPGSQSVISFISLLLWDLASRAKMGKTLLISVLFFVIFFVSATQGTEVKRENASKLLYDLFIVFSGVAIISIIFVFIEIIIVYTQKVSKTFVYELQDLCTIYRSILCAIFFFLVLDTVWTCY